MTIAGISIPGFDGKHGALQDIGTAAAVGGGIVATGTALTVASRWLLEKPMASPAMTTLKAFGVGAIVAGWWIGVLVYLLPRRAELRVAAEDTKGAGVAVVSALALVVAALWLQHCCKSPEEPPDSGDTAPE